MRHVRKNDKITHIGMAVLQFLDHARSKSVKSPVVPYVKGISIFFFYKRFQKVE